MCKNRLTQTELQAFPTAMRSGVLYAWIIREGWPFMDTAVCMDSTYGLCSWECPILYNNPLNAPPLSW